MIRLGMESNAEAVGLIEVMDVDFLDRRAQLGLVIADHLFATSIAIQAACAFVNFVFANYGIDKLQIETQTENSRLIAGLHRVCDHEGTLKRHLNIDGAWKDVDIFAIWRDDMPRISQLFGQPIGAS